MDKFGRRLSDLKGLTIDNGGAVYAITSHSMTNDIERAPDREHLVRFRVQAGSVRNVQGYTGAARHSGRGCRTGCGHPLCFGSGS